MEATSQGTQCSLSTYGRVEEYLDVFMKNNVCEDSNSAENINRSLLLKHVALIEEFEQEKRDLLDGFEREKKSLKKAFENERKEYESELGTLRNGTVEILTELENRYKKEVEKRDAVLHETFEKEKESMRNSVQEQMSLIADVEKEMKRILKRLLVELKQYNLASCERLKFDLCGKDFEIDKPCLLWLKEIFDEDFRPINGNSKSSTGPKEDTIETVPHVRCNVGESNADASTPSSIGDERTISKHRPNGINSKNKPNFRKSNSYHGPSIINGFFGHNRPKSIGIFGDKKRMNANNQNLENEINIPVSKDELHEVGEVFRKQKKELTEIFMEEKRILENQIQEECLEHKKKLDKEYEERVQAETQVWQETIKEYERDIAILRYERKQMDRNYCLEIDRLKLESEQEKVELCARYRKEHEQLRRRLSDKVSDVMFMENGPKNFMHVADEEVAAGGSN